MMLKSGLDLGACAYATYEAVQAINAYYDSPSSTKQQDMFANELGAIVGCATTGIGAALEAAD